ncbi:LptF/LptG family permease, partial [candidate division NPL-UPA2 bacterium]|nr:LptF/LptG family permease [candidate division NPL-UPA2 bacterium]
MRILDRYLARSLLTAYLGALLTFVSLYLIVDLFANSDEWLRAKMPASMVIDYYLNLIPEVFILIGPVALLLATLFGLGTLAKNNELTAIKASGISLYRTILPLLILSFFISLFTLLVNEVKVPPAARRVEEIKRMRRGKDMFIYRNIQLFGEAGNMFYIQSFDKKRMVMEGLQVLRYSPQGFIESRIDAKEAKWQEGRWVLHQGFQKIYDERGVLIGRSEPLRELDIAETPEDFSAGERRKKELSFRELKEHIRTLEKRGFRPRRELVELHSKLSLPLINFIIILIGIPFALRTRRGGLMAGFGKALGIGFVYLAFFRLGQLLGQG